MPTGFKISACVAKCCTRLKIKDISGVFEASDNPDGWEAVGRESANVTTATITITLPTGSVLEPVDVTSVIPSPVTGSFNLPNIEIEAEDGEYRIEYCVTIGSVKYLKVLKIYLTCNTRCCLDKYWAKVGLEEGSEEPSADCGCNEVTTSGSGKAETALFMESLHRSLEVSAAHNKTSVRDNLLKKIKRFCELEKCNCN